jgi:outer membrane protein assembly factor BamB
MAVPHVSGAIALVQSATDRDLSPAEIEAALVSTARKPRSASTPAGLRDVRYGAGIIDVPAAIAVFANTSAAFTLAPSTVAAGENVTLAASPSTGAIEDYEWDLTGDGSVDATGRNVTHVFPATGEYEVTLTVTDASGQTDTTTRTVPVRERWTVETGGSVYSSPTVVNGTVYVGSDGGNVSALDAQTGERAWRFETGGAVEASPTVVDIAAGEGDPGTVFVGSRDGSVYAIDAATGTEWWRVETGGPVRSSPTVRNGTVYVGSDDQRVYALDAATGARQWQFRTDGPVRSSPTVADVSGANATLFVGSNDNGLYALDAATGEKRWRFDTLSSVELSPTVTNVSASGDAEGGWTVYVSSRNDDVYALDAETGETRWTYQTRSLALSSPTVADTGAETQTVFIGLTDRGGAGAVTALDAATGEKRWQFAADDWLFSSPTVAGGAGGENRTVFIGAGDNFVTDDTSVYAIDARTGDRKWRYRTGGAVRSSPTVADSTTVGDDSAGATLFVGSDDGRVYALDAGVTGGSVGSRVTRGTLGHHGEWREQAPTALFTVDPARPDEPFDLLPNESVTLNASPTSGDIADYEWDTTGDGSVDATGETTTRAFDTTGNYDVTLTATTTDGERVTTTRTLSVNDPTVTERWSVTGDSAVDASPTVVDLSGGALSPNATAFVGNSSGAVTALDAVTGDRQWTFETGGAIESAPAVVARTAFVGSSDGTVYALNATTGERRWTFDAGSPVRSSPTVTEGTVYVGSDSDSVYALSAATGDLQWESNLSDPVRASPTVADASNNPAAPDSLAVFVGTTGGNVTALDAGTGDRRWTYETGGPVLSSPTLGAAGDGSETVYVGSLDGRLYALDAVTGAQRWAFETGGPVWSSPTVADTGASNATAFVGSSDERLYAVDAGAGSLAWRFDAGSPVRSSPTVAGLGNDTVGPAGGTIYVGSAGGRVYALSAATGEFRWRAGAGDAVESSPTVAATGAADSATAYVGSTDGMLRALDAEVAGPSAGSRVSLGTLGHTGAWATQPPVAGFTVDPAVPKVETAATFDAGQSFGATEYEWDLTGDGTIEATGETTTFAFQTAGEYDVTLTVTGLDGTARSMTRTVSVVGVPSPVTGTDQPQDLDGDGLFEDVRGDGEFTILDVQALFENLDSPVVQTNPSAFDFQTTGGVTILDVQELFNLLGRP